ncbi:MAG: EFR1 family ferrodoxin [Clostridia bacterium]|nr:EFR1 family ferrodoxin [Clostridia bacterium]
MVFYFTATGNSLYVAKQFDPDAVSIPQVKEKAPVYSADAIGIVCPVYCGEPPTIVLDFMKRATFDTPYLYMVLTYGKDVSDAPEFTKAQLAALGIDVKYIGTVHMVDNYLPVFDMDAQKDMDKHIDAQLEAVKADIAARKEYVPAASCRAKKLHKSAAVMNRLMPSMNNGSALRVTEDCYGCGICTQVCPIGNLKLKNGKSERIEKTCLFCLACIHACPGNAIRLKKEKNPNARYRNEHVSLSELIEANNQKII